MNQLSPSSNRIVMPRTIVLSLLLFAFLVAGCADASSTPEGPAVPLVTEISPELSVGEDVESTADTTEIEVNAIQGSESETTDIDDSNAEQPTSAESAESEKLSDSPEANAGLPLDQTTNILVLGSDRRPDTPNWRTDVMMIIALDRENGRAGVISIPRDVFIEEIPNHKPNRVNVVDYLGELDEPDGGGPALLAGIIERDMGIHIDHYLRFSFDSFREVVDALDGVAVDIDCEFSGFIEDEGGWLVLEPGTHRLTGNQAMIYVRDRALTGGDLNRARRQQRFVWAVRNQVLDENLVTRIPALYTALSGSVDTDIGLVTTLQLARLALALDPDDLYGMVLGPPDMLEEGWAMGMAVFLPDWETIAENVQLVFDSPPFMINNTPEECR